MIPDFANGDNGHSLYKQTMARFDRAAELLDIDPRPVQNRPISDA